MIVEVQRVLVYFLTFLKERLCLLHCLFISLLFYITRCDWVFQFVRSFNLGFLRSFFSLALDSLSSLSCLSSGHVDMQKLSEIIKAHSLIYCVLSMLSCCDNTKVCILTATHVYIGCIYVYTCAIHAI